MSSKTPTKKIDPKLILTYSLISCLLMLFSLTLFWGVIDPPPSADSYIFTRLSRELPSYSTSSDWIRVDRPDLYWQEAYIPDRIFEDAYETPIWVHPPLANILAWPFVQLIENERLLKIIPVFLLLISLYLIYLALRKKEKTSWHLLVYFAPIPLMTVALYGVPYFYHDTFMVLFLTLSMYLISRKSKWKYLAAAMMVLTKTPAIIFLLPLALWDRNWKMMLPGLAIIPYLGITWAVTGNPLYILDHWITMSTYIKLHYEAFISQNIPNIIIYSGIYIYLPILGYSIWKCWKLRDYYYAPVLGILSLVVASWAFIPYQMTPMLISLPIMVSIFFKKPNVVQAVK